MADYGVRDFRRLIGALRYSLKGLRWAMANETAFRQELLLAVVLVPLALWLGERPLEHVLLIGSILLLLIIELLNSGIEAAVDRVGEEVHPLAGRAKDLGSAAVLMALLHAAMVWGFLGLPKLVP